MAPKIRIEKEYGDLTVSPRNGEYAVLTVPKQALQDPDMPVERGGEVAVKGVVEPDGETYIKIGGE